MSARHLLVVARALAPLAFAALVACAHGNPDSSAGGAGGANGNGGHGGMAAHSSSTGPACTPQQCTINCMSFMKCGICENDLCTCLDPQICASTSSHSTGHGMMTSTGSLASGTMSSGSLSSGSLSSTSSSISTFSSTSSTTTFSTGPTTTSTTATATSSSTGP